MGIRRAIADLKELRRNVVELFDDDRRAEAHASYQIAKSAQQFSHNAREVVDDKLSFSATLMRAGEVQAANRLLAEVERQVRDEEAALIETVNEVKVAQTLRRERMTRLRLARMIGVATVGSALLTFSAAGMAVANFLRDRADSQVRTFTDAAALDEASNTSATKIAQQRVRRLQIGDVSVVLTQKQYDALRELTGRGDIDPDGLGELLDSLPQPLADKLQEAITVASAETEPTVSQLEQIAAEAPKVVEKKKRAAKRAEEAAAEEQAQPSDPEPTPEPTDDGQSQSNGGGDGGDTGSGEEGGDDGGPPLPVHP